MKWRYTYEKVKLVTKQLISPNYPYQTHSSRLAGVFLRSKSNISTFDMNVLVYFFRNIPALTAKGNLRVPLHYIDIDE